MISEKGLNLIISFEGFSAEPYRCPAGVPTIGYGTTHYPNGTRVKMSDKPISKKRAYAILKYEVDSHYGKAVEHSVGSETTQEQLDAMISFAYNLGTGAFKRSTLLKQHNRGKTKKAANEFAKWTHANGKVLKGLVRRRSAEKKLYLA